MHIEPVFNRAQRTTEADLTITQTMRGTLQLPIIQLEVMSPSGQPITLYDVGLHPVVVGAQSHCDIVVRDPHVSGEHCEIQLTQPGVLFRDRGSKNGSFLGNIRVLECILAENAVVRVGGTRITVRHRGPRELPLSAGESFGANDAVLLGQSLLMRTLFAQLEQVRHDARPFVLMGESGTGRTLLARALAEGKRGAAPFESVNCQELRCGKEAETLFGSVINGKRPGILEKASGGLVFLGNVDELPANVGEALVKTLRTQRIAPVGATPAQQPVFRAQVIASVKPGRMEMHGLGEWARAQDAIQLVLPPLRYRKDDIPLLVKAFLGQRHPPKNMLDLPHPARAFFQAHSWPGNVAELRKFVGLCLSIENVKQYLADYTGDNTQKPNLAELLPLTFAEARQAVVDHFDRAYLKAKLEEFGGNVTRTAKAIDVTRQHLSQLKREHGLGNDDDS